MTTKNILVFVHGMMPEDLPHSAISVYEQLWNSVKNLNNTLGKRVAFEDIVAVEWGRYDSLPRPDEKINIAERFIAEKIDDKIIAENPGLKNLSVLQNIINFPLGHHPSEITRPYLHLLRQTILLKGLGDAVYYCSEQGKIAVQVAVYAPILQRLEYYRLEEPDTRIRLHIIAHSLGVTIATDFLYGLFSPTIINFENERKKRQDHTLFHTLFKRKKRQDPTLFIREARDENLEHLRKEVIARYKFWRDPKNARRLELGSIVSLASQLPLLLLSKQFVVDELFAGRTLSPEYIGIPDNTNQIIWKIFYDIDDLLAFPTGFLYGDHCAIKDCPVDSGNYPNTAHADYWKSPEVHKEVAELLSRRMD